MVVIRLARGGAHKRPSYKVVVADSRKPRNGRFIEYIGYCKIEPGGKQSRSDINLERYNYWCSVGAKPSYAVKKLVRLKLRGGDEDKTVVMEEPVKQSEEPNVEKPSSLSAAAPSETKPEEQHAAAGPDTATVGEKAPADEPTPAAEQKEAIPESKATAAPAQQDVASGSDQPAAAAQEDSAVNPPEPSSEEAEKADPKPD